MSFSRGYAGFCLALLGCKIKFVLIGSGSYFFYKILFMDSAWIFRFVII